MAFPGRSSLYRCDPKQQPCIGHGTSRGHSKPSGIEREAMRAPRRIRERQKARLQEAQQSFLEAKAMSGLDVSAKTAKGFSLNGKGLNIGFRSSPDLNLGYVFRQPMNAKGSYDKRPKRSNLTDSELYLGGLDRDHKERGEVRIRVGTTPSHMAPITDKLTGETKIVRVRAKAKWADVGTQGITPKDGGKDG